MSTPKQVKRRPAVATPPIAADLTKAADVLFTDTPSALTLRDGTLVTVSTAKARHAGLLLDFFHVLVNKMDRAQIVQLVTIIEERKKGAGDTKEPESVDTLVNKVFDRSTLLVTMFHAVYDILPKVVGAMSNISAERFEDLDLDEACMVTYRVFADNYAFFSQNLPVMARVFFQLAAAKV